MSHTEQRIQHTRETPLHFGIAQRVGSVVDHLRITGKTELDIIDMEYILGAGAQLAQGGMMEYAFAGGVFPDEQEAHRSLAADRLQIALSEGPDIGLYRVGATPVSALEKVGTVSSREMERVFGSHMITTEIIASEQKSLSLLFLPLEFRLAQVQLAGEPMGFEEAVAQFAHPHFSRETYEATVHMLQEAAFPIV